MRCEKKTHTKDKLSQSGAQSLEPRRVETLDSTLRDGAQAAGISFSVSDKLQICEALDSFGIDYIEAGNPGSNPKDAEFFKVVESLTLNHAKLVAFGATRRKDTAVEEDAGVKSLLEANTSVVAIFGKSWDLHVEHVLNTTLEENLACVADTVAYFKEKGKEVIFDAEHFFDGYINNPDYACEVLNAAYKAGADVLVLCDTNGGTAPTEVLSITQAVCEKYPDSRIGIHCHNDIDCGVANSLVAVEAGACHVQGTFNGIGERSGNADLSLIIPSLQLKKGYRVVEGDLSHLKAYSARIAEISNIVLPHNKPYLGGAAFAHKAGMHIDGVEKLAHSFEHINPEDVGNDRRFLLSEVAGRKAVYMRLAALDPSLEKDSPKVERVLEHLKEREHEGYQYEGADASFELMVSKVLGTFDPHFELSMYRTSGEFPPPDGHLSSSAIVKIKVGDKGETSASMGNGPVNALDQALKRALCAFYPVLDDVHLIDYKVRVLESDGATASRVRVLIESTDGFKKWTTVGVSTDIIKASFEALSDSLEYKLYLEKQDD